MLIATEAKVELYWYGKDYRYLKASLRLSTKDNSPTRNFIELYENGDVINVILADEKTDYQRLSEAVKILYDALAGVNPEERKKIKLTPEQVALIQSFVPPEE